MALTNDPNYKKLEQWYKANGGSLVMRDMFQRDQDRFSTFRWVRTPGAGGGWVEVGVVLTERDLQQHCSVWVRF